MYDSHFGLKETPFTIAPDPRFLYMSERHREALAHLMYCFDSDGGFVLLTGEVGTGKTTISRCLLEQLPRHVNIAFILNPKMSSQELLAAICDELHIKYPEGNQSLKRYVDCINRYLLEENARGRKTIVIIEEAQNLQMDVLEQLRLLTNLETNQRKLLQIIMIGQPELLTLIARPELRQLEQRITARYHLLPLTLRGTMEYVKHRLGVAGLKDPVFSSAVLKKVYKYTGGVPRKINVLCDRAMLGAYVQNQKYIDLKILDRAAKEVFGDKNLIARSTTVQRTLSRSLAAVAAVVVIGGVAGLAVLYYNKKTSTNDIESARTPPIHEEQNPIESRRVQKDDAPPNYSGEQQRVERVGSASNEQNQLISVQQENTFEAQPADVDYSPQALDIIDQLPPEKSYYDAFSALFEIWGAEYSQELGMACEFAKIYGLNCLERKGNLRSLILLDRPAVLKLYTGPGRYVYVTLGTMDDDVAHLQLSDQILPIRLADLESRWLGDYIILWRVPPDYRGPIGPGSRGADVEWLATQLALINDQQLSAKPSIVYDRNIQEKVRNFQREYGLEADGIAGTQTLIQLNSMVDNAAPRLYKRSTLSDRRSTATSVELRREQFSRNTGQVPSAE